MALEKVPKIFDRVEFGRVRRKLDKRDVFGDLEMLGAMEAGTIPHHDCMLILGQGLRKLLQEDIDHFRIQAWAQQAFCLARLRAHSADHPEIIVLGLAHRAWSRAGRRPHASDGPLLAKAGFVLKKDLQAFAGLLPGDFGKLLGELFLKSACASGSARRC